MVEDWNKPTDCPGSYDATKVSCKDCDTERKTGCIHAIMMERQLAHFERSSGYRAENQSPPVTWREVFGKGPMDRFATIYCQFRRTMDKSLPEDERLEEDNIISLFQLYVDRCAIGLIDRIWDKPEAQDANTEVDGDGLGIEDPGL